MGPRGLCPLRALEGGPRARVARVQSLCLNLKNRFYIQENSWGLTSKALSATKWRKSFLEYYFFWALGFAHEIGREGGPDRSRMLYKHCT